MNPTPTNNTGFALPSAGNCMSGASWCVPVRIDKLGAHVQTLLETKDTIQTLRLCHQHGNKERGLAKMPIEVLNRIEAFVKSDKERIHGKAWKMPLKCVNGTCTWRNHFTADRIAEIENHTKVTCGLNCGCDDYTPCDAVIRYMKYSPEGRAKHEKNIHDWVCKIDQMPATMFRGEGEFVKMDRAVKKLFGLDVFISETDMSGPGKKSVVYAHLVLPSRNWISNHLHHMSYASSMSSHMYVDYQEMMAQLEYVRGIFYRALVGLNLRPYVNPLMIRQPVASDLKGAGPVDTIDRRNKRAAAIEMSQWPKLGFFVRAQAYSTRP